MEKGKILALDIGKSKIGVAISDANRQMAFGRGILAANPTNKLFDHLAAIIKDDMVKLLLIGLPMSPNGEDTPQTLLIKNWTQNFLNYLGKLKLKVGLQYIDESFSTFEANQLLSTAGIKIKEGKRLEDEMAAIILIHRYIDFKP